ncbi:MAG: hypothetical protein ACHQIO_16235 [Nevskiales bacterium]
MKLRELLLNPRGSLLLLPWAILVGLTFRTDPYGLAEEGAKALLLAWSVGEAVASAAFALGAPDIRAVVFLPLGFLWPGQVMAAKGLTLLVMAAAGVGLYRWRSRGDQGEAALLATGLMLIAPLCVDGIDALSAAPFLLAVFAAADWLNRKLATERGALGASFFMQLLACAAAVSVHPAGLAYPVLLLFTWWSAPPDRRHRQYFLFGIPLVVAVVLAMRLGWPGMHWLQNPLPAAAAVFGGNRVEDSLSGVAWGGGLALLAATLAVAVHERRRLLADLTGGTLLLGVVFGAVAADGTWGLLMFALLLYGGLPWLLRACAPLAVHGLLVQRGWLWLLLLLVSTAFMRTDRGEVEVRRQNRLSGQDQLIHDFAEGLNSLQAGDKAAGAPGVAILVASSWPARTSIACRCDGLPLPPAAKDPDSQLAMMRGVSYVILGDDAENRALANNFSQLGRRIEVLEKEPDGVILHFKPP